MDSNWSRETRPDLSKGIANITEAGPTVSTNTSILSSDALTLTIKGKGFDATNSSNNVFIFESATSGSPDVIAWPLKEDSSYSRTTLTTLVVRFTHLSPTNIGDLTLTLKISSTWSDEGIVSKIVSI